ncbi:hypothetical protein BEWA_017880 [Theileria equi strain WA]|uniref:Uncharacterized protein n=1 Tax=Theileria equi strain WA TaxID=1537102 RepID=L0ATI2_THEEQ|nr:hypothetical protein BEWA_017880 [Theileria equi strain WA]AFZ78947.1 hypothetical protein BEWA_017880 [Theileria equi strain WA]|eukprot:XP_004828613.1 hypothetical protein BEWA_017880 [Theileria equi strain WA]
MHTNRKESRNTILGVNTVIIEEETSESGKLEDVDSNADIGARNEFSEHNGDNFSPLMVERNAEIQSGELTTSNSVTSSNVGSFSSVFNTFIGFCDTEHRYRNVTSSSLGLEDSSKHLNHATSPLSTPDVKLSPRHKVRSMNDFNGRSNTCTDVTPSNKFLERENFSIDTSSGTDYRKDPKNTATLSCAVLLTNQNQRYKDDLSKKAKPPPYQHTQAPPKINGKETYGAMPSCYVLSKENDYLHKSGRFKSQPNAGVGFGVSSFYSKAHNRNLKQGNTEAHLNAYNSKMRSVGVGSIKLTPRRSNNIFAIFRGRRKMNVPENLHTHSMVTIVNKGASSIFILKVQNFCRNYLDINPDFGWRRLVDDHKTLPFYVCNNTESVEKDDLRGSCIFYIESKKTTHVITLHELAINIACRSVILAITHGYFDFSCVPRFLFKFLPPHISSNVVPKSPTLRTQPKGFYPQFGFQSNPINQRQRNNNSNRHYRNSSSHSSYRGTNYRGNNPKSGYHKNGANIQSNNSNNRLNRRNSKLSTASSGALSRTSSMGSSKSMNSRTLPKHYHYKGGVDFVDEECGKDTMYLKCNFLGVFVSSSIQRNLISKSYRKRFVRNYRSQLWRLQSPVFSRSDNAKSEENSDEIYNIVPVPNYGWKLLEKASYDTEEEKKSNKNTKGPIKRFLRRIFGQSKQFNFSYPLSLLSKIKPPHHSDPSASINVDIASFAMNLAEQLYRLEIGNPNREKLPKNTFGFTFVTPSKVTSPDGTCVDIVPEEIIMNTASLIHEIYITQTYLIM